MKKQLIFLTALLFIGNEAFTQEMSKNSLQKLKHASQTLNKALKRYTDCITGNKICSEQDKKKIKRAAQAMLTLLIAAGVIAGATILGTKKAREKIEQIQTTKKATRRIKGILPKQEATPLPSGGKSYDELMAEIKAKIEQEELERKREEELQKQLSGYKGLVEPNQP